MSGKSTSTKKKRSRGQPSKYKKEYCDAIIKFFDIDIYEVVEIEHYNADGSVKWIDKSRV